MRKTKFAFRPVGTALSALLLAPALNAQQSPQSYSMQFHYLLYLPQGYSNNKTTEWPLIIFLHGSGECGDDLEKVKVNGLPRMIEQGKEFPFIIASPQAPSEAAGFQAEQIKALILDLKKKYWVDPDRIYLTGLSMGGYYVWDIAEKHPEEFAAIAPICSGGPLDNIYELRHIPVWCFHGAKDDNVPPAQSQRMVDSLRHFSAKVWRTLYPNANHNSWDTTYHSDTLYQWLLAQRKYRFPRVSMDPAVMQQFAGVYLSKNLGTDTLRVNDGKFYSTLFGNTVEYMPSSDSSFVADFGQDPMTEIVFYRDKFGKPVGFWCYDPQFRNEFIKEETGKTTGR